MIKFLMSLFTKKDEEEVLPASAPEPVSDRDFDIVDYDGMGNQGRFPSEKNNKRGRK